MKKIFICIIMVLSAMFFCTSVMATEKTDDPKYVPKVIVEENFWGHIYYDPVFDSELAKTCRKLSYEAYGIDGDEYGNENNGGEFADELDDEGFVDIQQSDANDVFGFFEATFMTGAKTFEINGQERHVVAVVFRGTHVFADLITDGIFWDNASGFHTGFYNSASKAFEILKGMEYDSLKNEDGSSMTFDDYMDHVRCEPEKYSILVTGHSLGGALANVFTATLLPENLRSNVMCYTFASPIVCKYEQSKNYNAYNIFNIINKYDFVPYLGVDVINGVRFGRDFVVEVEGSESWVHSSGDTYRIATEMVIDDIERSYNIAYRKKYTTTQNGETVVSDELHIVKTASLEKDYFGSQLGNVNLVIDKADVTINTDIITDGNVTVDSGGYDYSLSVQSGRLKIGGNLTHGGTFNIGNAFVEVYGDYNKAGACIMEDDDGYFFINGDLNGQYFGSWSGHFTAKAGTLEVKGDVNQFTGYRAEGTHRMILSGAAAQKVDMDANGGWGGPGITNNLKIINTSEDGVEFTGTTYIIGEIHHDENSKIVNSQHAVLTKNASVKGVWNGDLSASGWISDKECRIKGDLILADFTFAGYVSNESEINADVSLTGDLVFSEYVKLGINSGTMTVENVIIASQSQINLTNPAELKIRNNLEQGGSAINVGSGRIEINGDYNMNGTCTIDAAGGYMLVKGNLNTQGSSFKASEGVLEVKGNIGEFNGLKASGNHKLVLSGDSLQQIDAGTGSASWDVGEIHNLEILNTSEEGVEFTDYVQARGEICTADGAKVTGGENLVLTKNASVNGVWNGDLSASGWTSDKACSINGDLIFMKDISESSEINADVSLTGDLVFSDYVKLGINSGTMTVENVIIAWQSQINLTNPAELKIRNNLEQGGSAINVGSGRIEINGDYNMNGTCTIDAAGGYMLVKGNLNTQGSSFKASEGVLEVKGNIGEFNGLRASGNHKLVLSGDSLQQIDAGTGSASWDVGEINILEILNTSAEGVEFTDYVKLLCNVSQPVGTKISGMNYVMLKDKVAFVDYGELNAKINAYMGNEVNVIPTWFDYELYFHFNEMNNDALVFNESVGSKTFKCDLYFSNDYGIKKTADVVVAFYDANKCLVRTVIIPVVAIPGKINVSTDYEKKDYSTYKIMVWEDTENIRPLMAAK